MKVIWMYPLVVRDRFANRAPAIEGWYDTEDEVLVRDGVPFRRRGDANADG